MPQIVTNDAVFVVWMDGQWQHQTQAAKLGWDFIRDMNDWLHQLPIQQAAHGVFVAQLEGKIKQFGLLQEIKFQWLVLYQTLQILWP